MEFVFSPEIWVEDLIDPHIWEDTGTEVAAAIITEASSSIDGDYTAVGWYNNLTAGNLPCIMWDIGPVIFQFIDSGSTREIQYDNTFESTQTVSIDWDGTAWECFFIQRDGTTYRVYEGTTLVGTWVDNAAQDLGTEVRCISTTCTVFDLKIVPRVMTEADMAFYYNNVLNNKGDVVLPNF